MSSSLQDALRVSSRYLDDAAELYVTDVSTFCSVATLSKDAVYEMLDLNQSAADESLSIAKQLTFIRIVQIFRAVLTLFEDVGAASTWVLEPAKALNGDTPISCASTSLATELALRLIGRLEHGMPS